MDIIKTWSFSRLTVFEQCPLRAKLAYIDRIPEPPRPLPAGKTEHANDRGTRVHTGAELYITKEVELIQELQPFKTEMDQLKDLYKSGKVSIEGEWAYTSEWVPTAWTSEDAWLRMKLDAMVHMDDKSAAVIDHKTGKKAGNEVKHAEQGQIYQLGAFMRFPKLEKVTVEFWYLDQDDITRVDFSREQGLKYLKSINERAKRMTSATFFPAKPNVFNCRWCPYGPRGTKHCDVGV
jgi:RecB family exonuclease